MITRAIVVAFLLLGSCSQGFSFEIYHNPPDHFLQGVPGQLEVILPHYLADPDFVKLFIREQGKMVYQELTFYEESGAWYCDIPAAYMNGDKLSYYIGASFGPAGLAAFPAENPDTNPVQVPLLKFITKNRKFEPKLIQDVIVDHIVTPWKPKPLRRSNNFPVLYIPKANQAFIESGYIKIVGNDEATLEDLFRSMLYLCLQENADAITNLNYSLLSSKEGMETVEGHIELEGVYLRRPPRN
ncbi:MAG: hypothetical protein HON50_04685 [Candidatus Marinimicrobia bacterium]|nr:hypothetical protein [Candidatus Neomarinimicrobiota bacterium]MBT6554896.1 hypothetical protein [Candidatus Neomarinimicrobiota bacterium]